MSDKIRTDKHRAMKDVVTIALQEYVEWFDADGEDMEAFASVHRQFKAAVEKADKFNE